jgi:aldehyde dehydrogenase (NAD+)
MSVTEIYEKMSWGPAPEGAELAFEWLDNNGRKFGHFISHCEVHPKEGKYFETLCPANAKRLAEIAQGGKWDIDEAVAAAREAQPHWWAKGGYERAKYQ